jgi:acyl carrier protein
MSHKPLFLLTWFQVAMIILLFGGSTLFSHSYLEAQKRKNRVMEAPGPPYGRGLDQTPGSVEKRVHDAVASIVRPADVDRIRFGSYIILPHSPIQQQKDLHLDLGSFEQVELAMALEHEFRQELEGKEIPAGHLAELTRVGDVVKFIEQSAAAKKYRPAASSSKP